MQDIWVSDGSNGKNIRSAIVHNRVIFSMFFYAFINVKAILPACA